MTGIKQQWGKGNSNLLAELVMTRFERVRCGWICDWLHVQIAKSSLHISKKEWVVPPLLFIFIVIGLILTVHVRSSTSTEAAAAAARHYSIPFIRSSFPASFIFGAGSAAYQFKELFWTARNYILVSSDSGDEDVPGRGKSERWNEPRRRKFYNNLLNELLSNGIVPFVTLFVLPQALEDEYGGFLNHKIIGDFQDYADFCFKTFGDRVAHWITLKEPVTFCVNGFKSYNGGTNAPGRCSNYVGNCTAGNSATEPYIVGHHLLLAHTHSVNLYKKYQTALSWLYIYPKGIQELMLYIKETYNDPKIYITENGIGEANNNSNPLKDALKDGPRGGGEGGDSSHGHFLMCMNGICWC